MEDRFAKVISYLFHPIFLPLYCLLFLFNIKSYFNFELIFTGKLMLLAFVAITTILFPLLIFFLMKRQRFIQSYQLNNRQDRLFPYLITLIFYFLTYNMYCQMQLHYVYRHYMLGASVILLLVILISLRWKISTHMTGIGGVFGMVTGLSITFSMDLLLVSMIVFLLAGLIGYARLQQNAHKPLEIYIGFIVGTLVMLGMYVVPQLLL